MFGCFFRIVRVQCVREDVTRDARAKGWTKYIHLFTHSTVARTFRLTFHLNDQLYSETKNSCIVTNQLEEKRKMPSPFHTPEQRDDAVVFGLNKQLSNAAADRQPPEKRFDSP